MAQNTEQKKPVTKSGTGTKDTRTPKNDVKRKEPVLEKTNTHPVKRDERDMKRDYKPKGSDKYEDKPGGKRRGPSEPCNAVMPYVLIVIAALLLLLYAIIFVGRLAGNGENSAGAVGAFIRNLFLWLLGWASFGIPAALTVVALRWRKLTAKDKTHGGLWFQCVMVLFLTGAVFELLFDGGIGWQQYGEYMKDFTTFSLYAPGGFFGGLIALAMRSAFAQIFSAIVLILVDLVLILFFVGLTPDVIYRCLKERHEYNRERRAAYLREVEEARRAEAEAKEAERMVEEAAKKEAERLKKEEEAIKRVQEREAKRREAEAKQAAKEAEKEAEKRKKEDTEAPQNAPNAQPEEDDPYAIPEPKNVPTKPLESIESIEELPKMDAPKQDVKAPSEKPEEKTAHMTFEKATEAKTGTKTEVPASENTKEKKPEPEEDLLPETHQPMLATDLQYDLDEERARMPKTALPGDDELILSWENAQKPKAKLEDPLFPELMTESDDDKEADDLPGEMDDTGLLALPNDLDALDDDPNESNESNESEGGEESEAPSLEPESTEPPEPEYVYPPTSLLVKGEETADVSTYAAEVEAKKEELASTLRSFNIRFRSIEYSRGPTITRYEIQPEPGQRVKAIQNLMDDIALNMAVSGVRFEPSISGKSAVGIEVPNDRRETVTLRSLVESETFTSESSKLTACLGADITGKPVVFDVSKMPHLLVAGATGMGKSVCINSIIVSLMYKAKPEELRLILIDPKKVEFAIYRDMPHLLTPIITDPQKAAGALCSAVSEMEKRFELIERVGARDIKGYKKITAGDPDMPRMSHIVIIIDELADLMMTASNDVEAAIMRIAQKARAAGIHLIIGTQRPSVDVITGTIKANIPSRIACTVASQTDSRTILDAQGAEKLCGRGDMLFAPVGASRPRRVQGSFVSDDEVIRVVNFMINNNGTALYDEQFMENINIEAERCMSSKKASSEAAMIAESDEDPKLNEAIELAIECGKISTSLMQRRLEVGYGRAAKIIDRMEQLGYVSAAEGNKPRKILVTMEEYRARCAASDGDEGEL